MDSDGEIPGLQPDDVDQVTASAGLIFAQKTQFIAAFYDALFEALPETRSMFSTDLGHQKEMVLAVIATVLRGVAQPQKIAPVVKRLAIMHENLGVRSEHLDVAADALTRSAHLVMGDRVDEGVRGAWARVFRGLTDVIKSHMVVEPT